MKIVAERVEGEFWDQRLALMDIPGSGDGLAVLKEVELKHKQVSVFSDQGKFTRTRFEGEPLRLVSRTEISAQSFSDSMEILTSLPVKEGVVIAVEGILGGEAYLIVRRSEGHETRLVLIRPRMGGDPHFIAVADTLDSMLGDV